MYHSWSEYTTKHQGVIHIRCLLRMHKEVQQLWLMNRTSDKETMKRQWKPYNSRLVERSYCLKFAMLRPNKCMPTLSCHLGIMCKNASIPLSWYSRTNQGVSNATGLVTNKVSHELDNFTISHPRQWVRVHVNKGSHPSWFGLKRQSIVSRVACYVHN